MQNYMKNVYFESTIAHNCAVWDDKDVLDVDIKGEGCLASFKRFWYNLFLLSFTDRRARHYYTSSHAIKVARALHFRHYRGCIHPLSKFRNFWEFLILLTMLLNKVVFHMNSSMIHDPSISTHYTALVCEVVIILDVYLNFKTGYADKAVRKIYMDPHDIMNRYMSTNLCIHVASAVPLEAIMFLKYGTRIACSPCKSNMFIATTRFFSLISTIRVFEMSNYWSRDRSSYKMTIFCKCLRSVILGMVVMMQILTFSDAVMMTSLVMTGKLDTKSYASVILTFRYDKEFGDTNFLFLCLEISRICKSFLLFGYGLQPNYTTLDQLCALVSFCVAYTFHVWIFLGLNNCLTRINFSEEMFITNLDRTKNILRARLLPDVMYDKVTEYYQYKRAELTLTEKQNGLFAALPGVLKRDIALSCYRRHVMRLPFFAEWPFEVINEIALVLQPELFMHKDVVGNANVQGDGLFIVEKGLLAVYSANNVETCHLIDGDYFGELSLVTDKEVRVNTVVAVSYCSILLLSKKHFRKIMRDHPQLFFDLKRKFYEAYNNDTKRETGHELIDAPDQNVEPGQN